MLIFSLTPQHWSALKSLASHRAFCSQKQKKKYVYSWAEVLKGTAPHTISSFFLEKENLEFLHTTAGGVSKPHLGKEHKTINEEASTHLVPQTATQVLHFSATPWVGLHSKMTQVLNKCLQDIVWSPTRCSLMSIRHHLRSWQVISGILLSRYYRIILSWLGKRICLETKIRPLNSKVQGEDNNLFYMVRHL